MWYSLSNGQNDPLSFGFASQNNKPKDVGKPVYADNDLYTSTVYERVVEITDAQYAILHDFGKNPDYYGFDTSNYNVLTNNCVDFVWIALGLAGFNTNDYEGTLLPSKNLLSFEYMLDPLSQHMTFTNSILPKTMSYPVNSRPSKIVQHADNN